MKTNRPHAPSRMRLTAAKRKARKGMSLLELGIVVGLVVVLAGVILLTVANRASNIKLENYANQIANAVQIQQQMKARGVRTTTVDAEELMTSLQTLLQGSPDFNAFTADVTAAAGCGSTKDGVTIATTAANITETDTAQLAAFIDTAVQNVFDGAVAGTSEFKDIFAGDGTPAVTATDGFHEVKASSQIIYLCFN